jgi:hypothetical protein
MQAFFYYFVVSGVIQDRSDAIIGRWLVEKGLRTGAVPVYPSPQ